MKRSALLLLFALCLPLSARADDASKRAKIQEMLELRHIDRSLDQMMNLMKQQAIAATNARLGSKGASPDLKARAAALQKQLFDFIESQLGWSALEPGFIDMYDQAFTEDEIDGMLAFYKSPAGVAMINKTPELTQKSAALASRKMLEIEPQLNKMIQDFASTAARRNSNTLDSN
jgi:hypothetical protein